MMRIYGIVGLILIAVIGGVFLNLKLDRELAEKEKRAIIMPQTSAPDSVIDEVTSIHDMPPIGDGLLEAYGTDAYTPMQDVAMLGATVENFFTLFKNMDSRFISTNEEIAALLKGENNEKLVYVSPSSRIFGPNGHIVDRWGTPIFVHPITTGLVEIRIAGPDKELFTADDLHRTQSGIIHQGAEMPEMEKF